MAYEKTNINIKGEAVGFSSRLFAYNIDISILMVVYVLCSFFIDDDNFLYGSCILITTFYYALMESSGWQGTLGKKYNKLKVVNSVGNRISFPLAFFRVILKYLSIPLLFIAIFMIYLRRDRRSLHDLVIGTSVIKK